MSELQDPEIFQTVLDSLPTGVYVVDRNGKIFFWNQGAERITGFMRHEVVGRSCRESILVHCNGQGCVDCGATCSFSLTLHEGKAREARMRLRHKEGHPIPVLMRTVPIRDRHGIIVGAAESFEEQRLASDRDRRQRNLTYDCADETTGMPNHEFTQFHLRENLTSFEQYHLPFGIMRIRVDRLKEFRAAYGRQAGDAILRVVAQTMRDSLRPSDFLGRWEEDEFLVILANCGTQGVEKAADRIRSVVNCAGLRWWGDELTVSTRVGHSIAQGGDTIDSLLSRAQGSLQQTATAGAGAVTKTENS